MLSSFNQGHEHFGPPSRDGHTARVRQVAHSAGQSGPVERRQALRPEREEEGEEIESHFSGPR